MKYLGSTRKRLASTRHFISVFISIWNGLMFLISMIVIDILENKQPIDKIFDISRFKKEYEIPKTFKSDNALFQIMIETLSCFNTPLNLFILNVSSSLLCFLIGKFSCQISSQVNIKYIFTSKVNIQFKYYFKFYSKYYFYTFIENRLWTSC